MSSIRAPIPVHEKADLIDPDSDLWKCKTCGEELDSRDSVHQHVDYYHQSDDFSCRDCIYVPRQRSDLKKHVARTHMQLNDADPEEGRCVFCQNAWPKSLRRHMRECPKPRGKLREGWEPSDVPGIYRRKVQPHEEDGNSSGTDASWTKDSSEPKHLHYTPQIKAPQITAPQSASQSASRSSNRRAKSKNKPAHRKRPPRRIQPKAIEGPDQSFHQSASTPPVLSQHRSEGLDPLHPLTDNSLPQDHFYPSHSQPAPHSLDPYNNSFASSSEYYPHTLTRMPPFSFHPDDHLDTLHWTNPFSTQSPTPDFHHPIDPRFYHFTDNNPHPSTFDSSSCVPLNQSAPHDPTIAFVDSSQALPQQNPILPPFDPSPTHPVYNHEIDFSHYLSQSNQPLTKLELTETQSHNLEDSHHFQPRYSLGSARIPLTHRQALRYLDLVS